MSGRATGSEPHRQLSELRPEAWKGEGCACTSDPLADLGDDDCCEK